MENTLDFSILLYKVLGSLGVVLAVLFAVVYCFKRMGRFPGKAAAGNRIRLLARQSVGPKHHLVMVEAADRLLLLGISPEGIRLLSPLGGVGLPIQENEASKEAAEPPQAFQNILHQMTDVST
jgi:flagellar biosynthetic protein FliO